MIEFANWKHYNINVQGKEEEVVPVIFTFLKDPNSIKNIDVSCGCTDYKMEGMFLKVNLKLPKKFIGLEAVEFETTKFLYITYTDDTTETLTIVANVKVKT